MRKRTKVICLHEGVPHKIDRKFANGFIKAYRPKMQFKLLKNSRKGANPVSAIPDFPPSLSWSCKNWRSLCNRMKQD
jgi:hypothetical protein